MKHTRNVNHRTLVKQNENNETSAAAIFSASIGDLFDRQAMAKVNIFRCLGMGHIKITAIKNNKKHMKNKKTWLRPNLMIFLMFLAFDPSPSQHSQQSQCSMSIVPVQLGLSHIRLDIIARRARSNSERSWKLGS
jgi:hypothetical protein